MKKLFINKYVRYGLFVIGGIFIGWLFFHSPRKVEDKHQQIEQVDKAIIWTCAMHPQIRMDKPGKCPICGMELIPLNQNNAATIDPDAIHLTKDAAELANVLTSVVTRQKPIKEVRLYGKVQADERLLQNQVAHLPGRIEKLMVNFTGEGVSKGQTLALIYSPELVTAQQELLEAAKTKQSQPEIYEAAKEKLHLWKITDSQIADIESSGRVQNYFEVVSNTNGIVMARRVNNGDHIAEGAVLYDIADLSHVWVMFDAYESDLPFLSIGDKLSFTVQAIPGNSYSGKIIFIDPVLDPLTRVAKVRVEINNESGILKPEMFATGIVKANLEQFRNKLIIPRSAVLWTGKRSIVYVKQTDTDESIFKIREVDLGPMLGNSYVIMNGLNEGEEIVTQGTFSVDAAAQLEGKPSMMNHVGGKTNTMSGMDMGTENINRNSGKDKIYVKSKKLEINPQFKEQLTKVYKAYLPMKNAFVKTNPDEITQLAGKVSDALDNVDMKLLEGETHMVWMNQLKKLKQSLNVITKNQDIKVQREAFGAFNLSFYQAVKDFGLEGVTTYYQYCPMAIDQKGAYWFSEIKKIENPYFGDKMMSCGETSETLKY